MITIQELLLGRGIFKEDGKSANIKLVRHKDGRCDLYEKYRTNRDWFLGYQNSQSKPVFHETDYIVSFIGEGGGAARFVGVYRVTKKQKNPKPVKNDLLDSTYLYEMEEERGFEDLKERVLVRWTNPISWHQWFENEMEVIEIQRGFYDRPFTDYLGFILKFDELKEIVSREYADWKLMLSATNGIYLVSDARTGKLYVGSAYGENGIWGRWCEYVRTKGHGNNKLLKGLLSEDKGYGRNFQFSVLMLLPSSVTANEAIAKERLFKKKLGTNAFGLNDN